MMDIFNEHFDEAIFLWQQREQALVSPKLALSDTQEIEWRLCRHVDAMVLAGVAAAKKQLVPLLETDEPAQIAVASLVLIDEGLQQQEVVLSTLRQAGPTQRLAISQSLQARPRRSLETHLLQMMESSSPELQVLLLDVLSDGYILPTSLLEQCFSTGIPQLQAAALRALRGPLTHAARAFLIDCLSSKLPDVRQAAITTGLVLGVDGAWRACLKQAANHDHTGSVARLIVAFGGEALEQDLLLEAIYAPAPAEVLRQTLWALGFSGRLEAAEACLVMMSSHQSFIARLAGEAFCAITGLRLEGVFVLSDDAPSPDMEEEDTLPTLLPEATLPLPATSAVTAWWHQHRRRFSANVRYLEGRPCSPEGLLNLLIQGSMRRRSALALELTLRSRGAWVPPMRAFMEQQQQTLQEARAHPRQFGMEPLAKLVYLKAPRPPAPTPSPPASSRQLHASLRADIPVITGLGMVSSLALGVIASCAAARAGLVHAAELEGCEALDPADGRSHPVRGHAIPQLSQGFTGLGRLARLGEAALGELRSLGALGQRKRIGLYVALPSQTHAQAYAKWLMLEERKISKESGASDETSLDSLSAPKLQPEQALLPRLVQLTGLPIARGTQRAFPMDAIGFLHALSEAMQDLSHGRLDFCILGGVDSLVDPSRLRALKALGLLKVPSQPARMLPGEAAAFLVLERHRDALRRGARVLATCEGVHVPPYPPRAWEGTTKVSRALAESLVTTLGSLEDQGRYTGRLIGGLNGHDRRAYVWGHTLSILGPYTALRQLPLWSPAESFGELGAATGAVSVSMAIRDFARGATASPHALIWLMEDDGAVGSFYIRAAFRERLSSGDNA